MVATVINATLFYNVQTVHAATITWDGGGATTNWSDCTNWSSNTCPGSADIAVFDSTSTKNSTINSSFGGTVGQINIDAGYTGTITMARSLSTTQNIVQASGSFTAGSQSLTIGGDLNQTGGTFTASSGTMTVTRSFTIPATGFNHNNGTINFTGNVGGTLTCNGTALNTVTFTNTNNKAIGATCSINLGNNPTVTNISISGTVSGSGTLTATGSISFGSTWVLSGFTGLSVAQLSVGPGVTADFSSYSLTISGLFIQSGGTFTAPANMSIGGFSKSGGTFNANGGTITVSNNSDNFFSCTSSVSFNVIVFSHTSGTKTINSTCTVPLGSSPTITGPLAVSGTISGSGTLTANSTLTLNSTAHVSGFSGITALGSITGSGTLTLSNDLTLSSTASVSGFSGLSVGGNLTNAGASLNLNAFDPVNVDGNVVISSGTVTAPAGTMTVAGNITKTSGTFTANGGTVVLDGTDQIISGTLTFYNLSKSTGGTTLTLPASIETTISGTLTLAGSSSNLLKLRSSSAGTQWQINPSGSRSVSFVDVKDAKNNHATAIATSKSLDSGNNSNWTVNSPTVSSLGPTSLIDGSSSGSQTQPQLTFTITDSDADESVRYQIQIDDSSDFSSPVVDYTSALASQGGSSFTVGQAAGSGSYATGSANQSLSNSNYYWRIKVVDAAGNISNYNSANSGNIAFVIAIPPPASSPSPSPSPSPTSSPSPSFSPSPSPSPTLTAEVRVPDFNLVLINGKRLATFPSTISFLPTNQPFTFAGTVTATGIVTIRANGKSICSAKIFTAGEWRCRTSTLPEGDYSLIFRFVADDGQTANLPTIALAIKDAAVTVTDVAPSPVATPSPQAVIATTNNEATGETKTLPPSVTPAIAPYRTVVNTNQAGDTVLTVFKIALQDAKGRPLVGVTVTLHSDPQTAITDTHGIATFNNISAGSHTLSYITPEKKTIKVPLTLTIKQDVANKVDDGQSVAVDLKPIQVQIPVSRFDFLWLLWPTVIIIVTLILGYVDYFAMKRRLALLKQKATPAQALDREIIELQSATTTTWPIFTKAHNWLRMHSVSYYWWHTYIRSNTVLYVLLGIYLVLTALFIYFRVK